MEKKETLKITPDPLISLFWIDFWIVRFYKMRFPDKQSKIEKYFPLLIINKEENVYLLIFIHIYMLAAL